MTATVIIPTTGTPELRTAIESVLNQTYKTKCYVVADGKNSTGRVSAIVSDYAGNDLLDVCYLPINVGANGFYGHRVYASFVHLINTDYVLFLDDDNFIENNHVEECIKTIESGDLDWTYSLRKIIDRDGHFLFNDDCESLGKWPTWTGVNLIDTSCYCLKTEIAIKIAQVWHMKLGADRLFPSLMSQHFPKYDCTGKYTVNYRLGSSAASPAKEFFEQGNIAMMKKYNGEYPWMK